MKKVLVIVALATLFAATAVNAQEFKFSAKGGLNLATLNGKDTDDAKMKVGFNLGLVGEYAFNEKMAIQPELLFSAQGAIILVFLYYLSTTLPKVLVLKQDLKSLI